MPDRSKENIRVAVLDDYQNAALGMADWDVLSNDVEAVVFNDHVAGEDALVERLAGFDIIVAMRERTPFTRRLMERLPDLKLLVTTGPKNAAIDLAAANAMRVLVCGTRGTAGHTAELTWGLLLATVRNIPAEDLAVRRGRWQTTLGDSLDGKVLGVLGMGNIGSRMATIGAAFGMSVISWSQNLTQERASRFGAALVTKEELFTRSDILTIHLQLSDRTRGLVGQKELGLMKPTAYIINTSRGPVVDEASLVRALRVNAIAGAGLDVFDVEPLPPHHPLLGLSNTVLTPHIGYVTQEGYRLFYGDCVEDIAAYLNGKPIRVLNPALLEAGMQYRH